MLQLRRFFQLSAGHFVPATVSHKNGLFPENILHRKHKIQHLYLCKEETAKIMDEAISPYLDDIKCNTAVEMNPGACYFTKTLLDREKKFKKIVLIESSNHFMPKINELHSLYPERVKVKHGDLSSLAKLTYQDQQDKGTRVDDLLAYIPKHENSKETNMILFGGIGSDNFIKYLITSLVFQKGMMNLGHCEMFLIIPPPVYVQLTCSNEIGLFLYRSSSILFQILFEYRFITRIPREHFLPPQFKLNPQKHSKVWKLQLIDPESLYLVKIAPRRDIYKLCSPIDLPALWNFVKQNCFSRKNRIIPNLEKWITGCGPRLLLSKKKRRTIKNLYKDENVENLPQYSKPCTTMSCQDFFPNMNIYTQFGELSPSQILTLFTEFRSWPEYTESSFLASLENSLLRMQTSEEENIDSEALQDEEDELILKETEVQEQPKTSTSKRKKKIEQ